MSLTLRSAVYGHMRLLPSQVASTAKRLCFKQLAFFFMQVGCLMADMISSAPPHFRLVRRGHLGGAARGGGLPSSGGSARLGKHGFGGGRGSLHAAVPQRLCYAGATGRASALAARVPRRGNCGWRAWDSGMQNDAALFDYVKESTTQ